MRWVVYMSSIREHTVISGFSFGNLQERGISEDPDIKKFRWTIKEKGWDDVDWIHMAHDRDKWWAIVSKVCFP
jgi:hypothetical protein